MDTDVLTSMRDVAEEVVTRFVSIRKSPNFRGVWTSGARSLDLHRRVEGLDRVLHKAEAERDFARKMCSGAVQATEARVKSSNLGVYRGILDVLLIGIGGVIGVQRTFHTTDKQIATEVDIVAGNGSLWIKVKSMNGRNVNSVLLGKGRYGERSLLEIAQDMAKVAQDNPVNFGPPTCVIVFASEIDQNILDTVGINVPGVRALTLSRFKAARPSLVQPKLDTDAMAALAEELGDGLCSESESEGSDDSLVAPFYYPRISRSVSITFPPPPKYALDPFYINRVNLDVTALFALTSDLTNGHNEFVFPHHKVLNQQATEDRDFPVLPFLRNYLKGKEVFVCETAAREFANIVSQVAGDEERERALFILNTAIIVPDAPSDRAAGLAASGRIKNRQKVVFGTGDSLQAVTLTANIQFVQAADDQGCSFCVFIHSARALTERKRRRYAHPLGEAPMETKG